jgi:hypothetical protein
MSCSTTCHKVNIRWLTNLLAPMLPHYHALTNLPVGMCGGLDWQNICGWICYPVGMYGGLDWQDICGWICYPVGMYGGLDWQNICGWICYPVGMCGGLDWQNICGWICYPSCKDSESKEILTHTWAETVNWPDVMRVTTDLCWGGARHTHTEWSKVSVHLMITVQETRKNILNSF